MTAQARRATASHCRKGFALAIALAALVVIGALVAGAFFASMQHYRSARAALLETRAFAAAELGLRAIVSGGWNAAWNATGAGTVAVVPVAAGTGVADTVRVTTLTGGRFLVTSDATVGSTHGSRAHRVVGSLVILEAGVPMFARGRSWMEW